MPIFLIDAGIVTLVKAVLTEKQLSPISSNPAGKLIVASLLHDEKAELFSLFIVLGSVTDSSCL